MKKGYIQFFLIAFGLLVIAFITQFICFFLWSDRVSSYCQKKAEAKVGKNWAKTVKANNAEVEQFPGLTDISLGFRQQLICEHDQKVLQKFPYPF